MVWLCAHGLTQSLHDDQRRFELHIAALTLGPGIRKAIVGPSGSGKTTAMDLLALAGQARTAESFLLIEENGDTTDIGRLRRSRWGDAAARIRARYFGYVLQTGMLLPYLTIGENVLLAQRIAGVSDRAFARDVLNELGITADLRTMPSDLSVGQRQRVAVARALAAKPRFLFADEPTAALDPVSARRTLATCLDIASAIGTSVLVISHDRAMVEEFDFEIVPVSTVQQDDVLRSTIDDRSDVPAWEPAA